MAKYGYSFQSYDAEKMARAVGRDLSISTKQSIEICKFLRRKNIQKAKAFLNDVVAKKRAVPYKTFTGGAAHRPGQMAGGKYPMTAAAAILSVIENAEANAQQKGLNTANLSLVHLSAQQAAKPHHAGRFRGRRMKRSHVEVVVAEAAKAEKRQAAPAKTAPKAKKETVS